MLGADVAGDVAGWLHSTPCGSPPPRVPNPHLCGPGAAPKSPPCKCGCNPLPTHLGGPLGGSALAVPHQGNKSGGACCACHTLVSPSAQGEQFGRPGHSKGAAIYHKLGRGRCGINFVDAWAVWGGVHHAPVCRAADL